MDYQTNLTRSREPCIPRPQGRNVSKGKRGSGIHKFCLWEYVGQRDFHNELSAFTEPMRCSWSSLCRTWLYITSLLHMTKTYRSMTLVPFYSFKTHFQWTCVSLRLNAEMLMKHYTISTELLHSTHDKHKRTVKPPFMMLHLNVLHKE